MNFILKEQHGNFRQRTSLILRLRYIYVVLKCPSLYHYHDNQLFIFLVGSFRRDLLFKYSTYNLASIWRCRFLQTGHGKNWRKCFKITKKIFIWKILMSLSSLFLLTSVFMLILSTVPGFQNATRDMFGVGRACSLKRTFISFIIIVLLFRKTLTLWEMERRRTCFLR